MGSRRAVVLLTLVALAGCGGDDDKADNGDKPDTQEQIGQDKQAKSDARNLVSFVEVCFVDSQDYSACKDAASGEDVGQATVESATTTEFTIISPSESGNEFTIVRGEDGALERACEKPGEGGCPESGAW